MAIKLRSPRYPVIGLREAIEKAKAVYEKDYRNKIPKELVAQHMGYTTLNGASLGVISAVSKFGLLEGGSGSMGITARAMDIFEREPGDHERSEAIRAAAYEPELFKDVASTFPGKTSDSAIRAYLITKRGFLPDTAGKFVRSYRETVELVAQESEASDSGSEEQDSIMMEPAARESKPPLPPLTVHTSPPSRSATPFERSNDERELTTGLLSKGASFRLIVSGKIGEKEIERLIKKLELDKEILADADEEAEDGGIFD